VGCVAWSGNGQLAATGGDDHKVKVWNTRDWFCFVTFSDHTGPISAVEFAPNGHSVVTASLDGTVRAFDLVRYRNYRTLAPPTPAQLSCVALDPAGEIVAAGAVDTFEVFVWSLQTGKLLDVLSGHEGPVCSLAFSPVSNVLASASWDQTVRLWEAFEGRAHREALQHAADCLVVAWRPDGAELCTASLDGLLSFWDPTSGALLGTIEGRDDIAGGRRAEDRRTAKTNPRGRAFTSVSYSPDGACVLAAGESKYVCLYEVSRRLLLRRFQTSRNLSLDGVLDFLNSARMTEAGPLDLIDDRSDASGAEEQDDDAPSHMPGAKRADTGARKVRLAIATKQVRFSPDARSWAAATTEGMLVYTLDDAAAFDPCELDIEVTAEGVAVAIAGREFLRGLLMAFRLNEPQVVQKAFEAVPAAEV
jgi:periodic tryptophan protein 2